MSKFGGLMGKAKDLVSQNRDKVEAGLDKAGDIVDQKTGGKHHDKIEKALDKADEGLDKWAPDAKAAPQEPAPPQEPPAAP
jgi:hypothetical protein